jgi:hypothetical protein
LGLELVPDLVFGVGILKCYCIIIQHNNKHIHVQDFKLCLHIYFLFCIGLTLAARSS